MGDPDTKEIDSKPDLKIRIPSPKKYYNLQFINY